MQKTILPFFLLFFLSTGEMKAQTMQLIDGEYMPVKMIIMGNDTAYMIDSPGDSLMQAYDYKGAILEYQKVAKRHPGLFAYNYACALSIDGQLDSAFTYLELKMEADTSQFDISSSLYALSDPDFLPLRKDPRWAVFRDKLLAKYIAHNPAAIKDIPLAEKLWDIMALDQAYYFEIQIVQKKVGNGSSVEKALWQLKDPINKRNELELDSIVQVKGWPKISQVGKLAASAAFLVIQHSTLELQQKYLPTIQRLCEQKEADWGSYALMYDRVQIGLGKPQRYGSQIKFNDVSQKFELFPIEDEKNVDKRRTEIGMSPLEEYVKSWNIEYKLPQ